MLGFCVCEGIQTCVCVCVCACVCFQKRSDSRLTADEDGLVAETGQWGI